MNLLNPVTIALGGGEPAVGRCAPQQCREANWLLNADGQVCTLKRLAAPPPKKNTTKNSYVIDVKRETCLKAAGLQRK